MIIILHSPTEDQVHRILEKLQKNGLTGHRIICRNKLYITASGDSLACKAELYERMPGVEKVVMIEAPFKLASREFQQNNTVVKVAEASFGGRHVPVIAGPCAIESYEQFRTTAIAVKAAGASLLRGGAYKPRTSPYSFQGLQRDGLEIIRAVRQEVGLPVVTEVTDHNLVEMMADVADMLQIGARNMQNFVLLQEVAKAGRPVLLKRGMAATMEEWLMAAEYILSSGNSQVVLCERGIRTFETYTRNTLDLNAIPAIHELSHLPIIVDPSHGTGKWQWVAPMAKAAMAAGADGLIIEVHPCPEEAVSDGPQSLTPSNFSQLLSELEALAALSRRYVCPTFQ
ncbi:MAG TPA: 3-deoxy-7-phosphoheptulonate synthase [Patescibacteria group bacterium]|nr:3-deoxy-7-phosphoheptulonate synthase [Patescibacteria group bacterium]